MATLGYINQRLTKEFPGVDAVVRLGIINDRYQEILERLPWSRLDKETVIQTVAQYVTGTVAITAGGTAITGTGTAWTAAMTGRQIHIAGRSEAYTFTYASATTGTIDRAYEGATETAGAYLIAQSIYALPSDCRIIRSLRNLSLPKLINRRDRAQGDVTDPGRIFAGPPSYWNEYMDDSSDPPLMQVELWPAADAIYSVQVSYTAEKGYLAQSDTSVAFVPWAQPGALMAGCRADLALLAEKLPLAQIHAGHFENLMVQMVNNESRRQGPSEMTMQSVYTRHRQKRWGQNYRDLRQPL